LLGIVFPPLPATKRKAATLGKKSIAPPAFEPGSEGSVRTSYASSLQYVIGFLKSIFKNREERITPIHDPAGPIEVEDVHV
jgi:hypothetical protein